MLVLVTYDVATANATGQKRLARVAKICLNFGQRVQNSVFECQVNPAQFAELKNQLLSTIDKKTDSIRFYFLGKNYQRRIEHHGAKPSIDLQNDTLII